MASRNQTPSSVQGFDAASVTDKMQSSTLKRQPSPDWSKTDLLRLLSYFEGELQARDITIATLKAEKAKQLLYQAKYGRFGLGDPFVALQRDAEGKTEAGFDESAIKSMYDNQLAQLENLIATQRKAQLKMREQLGNSEKRFHKVCTELEEEKQKHAQDTAQGDDVTYMLEKERERLKAEIDFEKNQNKKLEKDLKKTLASLEEERANAARHKQVAIMLIKERKNLIERIIAENQLRDEMEVALTDEKSRMQNMAEGLAQESKKSLKMEAALEKQNTQFDSERDNLRRRLQEEERQTGTLKTEVSRLSQQVEMLQQQLWTGSGSSPSSIQIRSSASPARSLNPPSAGRGAGASPQVSGSTTQSCHVVDSAPIDAPTPTVVMPPESPGLEFLGPEMANLQQLLATMTTGEVNSSRTHVTSASRSSPSFSSHASIATPSNSSFSQPQDKRDTQKQNCNIDSLIPTVVSNFAMFNDNSPPDPIKNITDSNKSSNSRNTQSIRPSSINLANTGSGKDEKRTSSPEYLVGNVATQPLISSAFSILNPSPVISPSSPMISPSPLIDSSHNKTHSARTTTQNQPQQSETTSVITSQPQSSSQSPSTRRRNAASRSRSKSPSKVPHHHHFHHHARSHSSSRVSSSGPQSSLKPLSISPNSSYTLTAAATAYLRLSPPAEVKASRVHSLASSGNVEALHSFLMERPMDVHLALSEGSLPLHCASENNHEACVKLLLDNGAKPSCMRDDRVTPLHIAAFKGHTGCLRCLLSKGAAVNVASASNQTPLHLAVKAGHLECCQLLLRHGANVLFAGQDGLTALHYAVQNNHADMVKALLDRLKLGGTTRDSDTAHQLVAMTDLDGWSISHMAAHLQKQDCLILLAENLPLDFDAKDKLGRPVKAVASAMCKDLLADIDRPSSPTVKVIVEVRYMLENTTVSSVHVGVMEVGPGIGWRIMEDRLRAVLHGYLAQLNAGLRTRRITRLDADLDKSDKDFTLGLMMANIKQFEMGFYKWTPGMQTDTSPYLILCNNDQKKVTITIDDSDYMCELIAFDVLHPVASINNYLRLLEQYKSVIFYGPIGSGKSYLAHRLAQSIAAQEKSNGRKPVIYQLSLQPGYSAANFLAFLKQKKCAVPVNQDSQLLAPIVLLDNLETVDIAQLFGELLDPMEYRGIGHAFCLRGGEHRENGMHYLVDHFYVIGTMNKARSLGVDLSILPRFRWVQFRLDTEPLRGLLARHFLRRIFNMFHGRLPPPDEPILRAIEWVVCVWQRLNDSLNKLGLPEVIMGPCTFFKCPLEKQDHKLILDWLKNMWNQHIAPKVREAVKRGTGSEAPTDGQQKVANTALYVLMQRSVILSCPLTGLDKENYLAAFSGSNELDIPLKASDAKTRGGSSFSTVNLLAARGGQPLQRPASSQAEGQTDRRLDNRGTTNSPQTTSQSSSVLRTRSRNSQDDQQTDSSFGVSNIKRRSLSESSVNKAALLEQQQLQQQLLDSGQLSASSQAKVAKLEVTSPKVVNIPSAFRSPSLGSQSDSESSSLSTPSQKSGRVSPLLSLVSNRQSNPHISQKKSRSSENISSSGLSPGNPKLRSPGPFSFSLATPTSKLNSFKFMEKPNGGLGLSLSEQMPDFSVFDKVPTPTDELPPSRSFVFVGKPSPKDSATNPQGAKEEEEVWSRRPGAFVPIHRPGGSESWQNNLRQKNAHS
ncbi:cortactin-binding protein 2 [Aplysia californica]|uniref:Cortactin-binding protein 2 n=1 Tax=Aplysia californica TaxID=6500 RepID=A0ABM0JMW4_APLCA|nr:cortactin-binding protein 2 [Aplysia californica]